jgi:hypothetical protein
MVVNNSTNINKTNNNLSHKIIEHKERKRHMALEIQIVPMNKNMNVAKLNRLMGTQPFLHGKLIS